MTTKKIKYVLEKAGLTNFENKWVRIPYFTVIKMAQDSNYYISESSAFYFDTENELLYATDNAPEGTDLTKETLTTLIQEAIYAFPVIAGFISSVYKGPQGTYYTRY